MIKPTHNLHVRETVRLPTPRELQTRFKMTETANETVIRGRRTVERILNHEDPRFLVVVGPCSIHDVKSALEYAQKLNELRQELEDQFFILMRAYFSKPRTTVGWKGLINDPHLDDSCDIEAGLKIARELLLSINNMGLCVATELLDSITPQYIADLISWASIGARTTESQTHREMASGLSMPIGFKNGTDGSLQVAIDAMGAAMHSHSFLGIDADGVTSIIRTSGNRIGHVILRGGRIRPNYDAQSIKEATAQLAGAGLPEVLMVDCSHANSGKKHAQQEEVWKSVIDQRLKGNSALIGMMVESFLHEGNQPLTKNPSDLRYGVSITDECIRWETTERMLRFGHKALSNSKKSAVIA